MKIYNLLPGLLNIKRLKGTIRIIYWKIRKITLTNAYVREKQISRISENLIYSISCPICGNEKCRKLKFMCEGKEITKFLCLNCGHIFQNNKKIDLRKVQELFNYNCSTSHIGGEKYLLERSVVYSKFKRGNYLDFGVGGNIKVVEELNKKYSEYNFYSCDINDRKNKYYFKTYSDNSKLGIFNCISSNAVIEHLNKTIETWVYFNRLLKPMKDGGGIMIHSFPSLIDHDLEHWSIKIFSHFCIFSRKSLIITCDKTGFKYIKSWYHNKVQHPIYLFKKIKDL